MGRTSDARARLIDAANDLIWEYSYGAITIDAICERAAVKKGSFYYFFESKSELAAVAIRAWWTQRQAVLENIFREEMPPLQRIRDYLEFVSQRQLAVYAKTGQVLGCPIYGLGAEISTQDEELRLLVVDILERTTAYAAKAIREAQALGQIRPGDAAARAQRFFRYYAGMLAQARIQNDAEPIRHLIVDGLELIGADSSALPVGFASIEAPSSSAKVRPEALPATLATSR